MRVILFVAITAMVFLIAYRMALSLKVTVHVDLTRYLFQGRFSFTMVARRTVSTLKVDFMVHFVRTDYHFS